MLKTTDPVIPNADTAKTTPSTYENRSQPAAPTATFSVPNPSIAMANDRDMDRWHFNGESPQAANMDEFNFAGNLPNNMSSNMPIGMDNMSTLPNNFTWEMIGLGLEEPLPPQETIDEL